MNIRTAIQDAQSYTLVEMLVVVGIITILTAGGAYSFVNFFIQHNTQLDAEVAEAMVRRAQQNAITGEGGSSWGVRFINNTTGADAVEIFSGSTYAASAVVEKENFHFTTRIANPIAGASTTILFDRITGMPSIPEAIALKASFGNIVYIVNVSALGKISRMKEEGLVGYWSMDEGSGTTTYDMSASLKNGTLGNGPVWQSGASCKSRACVQFDGSNDYIYTGSVNPTERISVAAWVKSSSPTGYSGYYQFISKYSAYLLGTSALDSANVCFIVYTSTWQSNPCVTVSTPDSWHHFVGTFNSTTGTRKIYMDGVDIQTATSVGAINADTGNIHFAHRENSAVETHHFAGFMDEVRIYDRALSATEVRELFERY